MSVPFWPDVAVKAVDILTDTRHAGDPGAALAALSDLFPRVHPVGLIEHLDDASNLIRAAGERARLTRAKSLAPEAALEALMAEFERYPEQSCRRALTFAIERSSG